MWNVGKGWRHWNYFDKCNRKVSCQTLLLLCGLLKACAVTYEEHMPDLLLPYRRLYPCSPPWWKTQVKFVKTANLPAEENIYCNNPQTKTQWESWQNHWCFTLHWWFCHIVMVSSNRVCIHVDLLWWNKYKTVSNSCRNCDWKTPIVKSHYSNCSSTDKKRQSLKTTLQLASLCSNWI